MDITYAITPFAAWLLAGTTKFVINSMKAGYLAFNQIGYGGLPSNHSAIASSAATIVALREGISHPAFSVAVAVTFIVALDAVSLRREIGKHAAILNNLADDTHSKGLRERMGHTQVEIIVGLAVGAFSAYIVDLIRLSFTVR